MHPNGLKKLEIGGDKNRTVFLVALSALILLGLGVTVWVFFGGGNENPSGTTDPDTNFQAGEPYQCAACEKEFRMTGEDFTAMRKDVDRSLGLISRLPHCPHCGAKHSGLQLVKCLKCRTLYVPYGLKLGLESFRSKNGELPPGARNVCPHCGTDQNEYSKKRWQK